MRFHGVGLPRPKLMDGCHRGWQHLDFGPTLYRMRAWAKKQIFKPETPKPQP